VHASSRKPERAPRSRTRTTRPSQTTELGTRSSVLQGHASDVMRLMQQELAASGAFSRATSSNGGDAASSESGSGPTRVRAADDTWQRASSSAGRVGAEKSPFANAYVSLEPGGSARAGEPRASPPAPLSAAYVREVAAAAGIVGEGRGGSSVDAAWAEARAPAAVAAAPAAAAVAAATGAPATPASAFAALPVPSPLPSAPRAKRVFRERSVPASPLARIMGFGSLAASMAFGAASEGASRALGLGAVKTTTSSLAPAFSISEAQAERLAEGLCRMRGAALKIGQMLSLSDETMIPPAVAKALERVRTAADVMPKRQLDKQMQAELGPEWRTLLGGDAFEETPIAAASIGQVHRSTLPDGRVVAIKVQYPGVAESIDSDLNNLKRLLGVMNFLPKGLYLDAMVQVAREELTAECDYTREGECQERFRALVDGDPDFSVPSVVRELSTRRVLVTTWQAGVPIDAAVEAGLGQAGRDRIARKLLKLTLRELFEWRFMQTDPNWGNFFYDAATSRVGLLDFGATRSFRKAFVDDYLRLVWAAANNDRATIYDVSVKLGFLTGHESQVMIDAHIDSGLVVGEPFRTAAAFDFKSSGITQRVGQHGATFAEHRLSAPPAEVYSLHRKLAGAFLICIRMGAVMPCRDMLEELHSRYVWGEGEGDAAAPVPQI